MKKKGKIKIAYYLSLPSPVRTQCRHLSAVSASRRVAAWVCVSRLFKDGRLQRADVYAASLLPTCPFITSCVPAERRQPPAAGHVYKTSPSSPTLTFFLEGFLFYFSPLLLYTFLSCSLSFFFIFLSPFYPISVSFLYFYFFLMFLFFYFSCILPFFFFCPLPFFLSLLYPLSLFFFSVLTVLPILSCSFSVRLLFSPFFSYFLAFLGRMIRYLSTWMGRRMKQKKKKMGKRKHKLK